MAKEKAEKAVAAENGRIKQFKSIIKWILLLKT